MNGKPQPTEPFLGGVGMLWKININNIKQNLSQAAPWPLLQTFICADSHLSSFQILNSAIQKIHFGALLVKENTEANAHPLCAPH